jgi:heptosyltransferase-1/heptosyltransferase I
MGALASAPDAWYIAGLHMADALKLIRKRVKHSLAAAVARVAVLPLSRRPRSMAEVAGLQPRSILAIRSDRVGDLLVSAPLLAAMHAKWPDARIALVAGPKNQAVLEGLPFVEAAPLWGPGPSSWSAVTRWLSVHRFDIAVSLRAEVLSGALLAAASRAPVRLVTHATHLTGAFNAVAGPEIRHHVTRYCRTAELLGVPCAEQRPVYLVPATARVAADAVIRAVRPAAPRPVVGVQVPNTSTSRHARRAWPLDRIVDLTRFLTSKGVHVVLCGFGPELQAAALVQAEVPAAVVAPPLRLGLLAALLETFDVFVSGFTGPLHLADAVGCPTVTIGSNLLAEYWRPIGPRHRLLAAETAAEVPREGVFDAVLALLSRGGA